MTKYFIAIVFLSSATGACKGQPAEETKPSPEVAIKATESATATVPAATAEQTAGVIAAIGVPACDALIDKYTTCLAEKAPADVREQLLAELRADADKWRVDAKDAQNLDALTSGCTERSAALAVKSEGWGCQW